MTDILQGIEFKCTQCGELKPRFDYSVDHGYRRAQCRLCKRKARRKDYYKALGREEPKRPRGLDFGTRPARLQSPNLFLRYHVCDPVKGELIATAKTLDQARVAGSEYHKKRRTSLKFVEIYDEETEEVFHLTRPMKRYPRGVLRGPCKPVSPDSQVSIGRGPGKKSITKQSEGNNSATTICDSSDSMPTVPDAAPGVC